MSHQIFHLFEDYKTGVLMFFNIPRKAPVHECPFLIAGRQLKPIFIQKKTPTLVFFLQLSKIFNNNFFNMFF